MSVVIKGMEMPKVCGECPAYEIGYTGCLLYSNGIPARYKLSAREKPDWCELIELPPHGRLIDADDFFRSFPELIPYEFAAPTILEAEEGE